MSRCMATSPSPSALSASSSTSSTSLSSHTGSLSPLVLYVRERLFEVVLIQGHEAEPDQPDPDGDRSGRPADDARVHPLRRPHVPPQIPGLKVDLLLKDVFYLFLSRTHEEEYSRAWGLFMLFHSNFSIHIHTVSIWYTLQV